MPHLVLGDVSVLMKPKGLRHGDDGQRLDISDVACAIPLSRSKIKT